MQDAEVDVAQLTDGCSESVSESCRGERVRARRVGPIERDTVMLANRAQGPFASAEAVELFIEHVGIDDEHPVQAADTVEERPTPVPMGFAIQNGQVKARVERDDRHTCSQLDGQRGGDLLDGLTGVASLGSRPLGGNAMHSARAGRYLDAGIHQPGEMLRRLTATKETHGCRHDAIGFGIDPGCLDVERGKTFCMPTHTTNTKDAFGRDTRNTCSSR